VARGIAFDRQGNLWVTDTDTVKRFAAGGLGASGSKAADVVLSSTVFSAGVPGPSSLAFDASGNLWVAIVAANAVVRFTPDQLAASGSFEPGVQLTGADLSGPAGLAFDAGGNLWVSNANDAVVKFNASRLGASDNNAADLVLVGNTPGPSVGTLSTPLGLAFDAGGNLWVAYFAANVIARYTATDQAGNGTSSLTPTIQLHLAVNALLNGLAFDEGGGLWTPADQNHLDRLAPGQLTSSGDITPATILTSTDIGSADIPAIYPAPANLPLFGKVP
jgi:sugar lactone lactonase YvrE